MLLWFLSTLFLAGAAGIWAYHTSPFTDNLMDTYLKVGFLRSFLQNSSWYTPYFNVIFSSLLAWVPLVLAGLVASRINHSPRDLKFYRSLFQLSYAVLLISFGTYLITTDFFQGLPGEPSHIFSGGTRNYINHRILNEISFAEDLALFKGLNYRIRFDEKLPYFSRTGFYGTLLKLAQTTTRIEPEVFLALSRSFIALITAGMCTAAALRLKKLYGFFSSIVFYAPVLVTYWIIGPTKILFIFNPVFYIPFLTSFFLYPKVIKGSTSFKRFLLYTFIAFCFVFLRGYTYISNLILSAAVVVFFHELLNGHNFKQLLTRCVLVCLTGTGAFLLVLALHIAQLSVLFQSVQTGASFILDRAAYRTSGRTDATYRELFDIWLQIKMFYFGDQYLLTEATRDFLARNSSIGRFHLYFFGTSLVSALLYGISRITSLLPESLDKRMKEMWVLVVSSFVALLSSWTWFSARGHMSGHEPLNGIIYVVPLAFFFYMLLGVLFQTVVDLTGISCAGKKADLPSG